MIFSEVVSVPPFGLQEMGAQAQTGQTSSGYNGRKGPKMATRGGRRPEPRQVCCPKCQQPLGLRGVTAVRRDGVLMCVKHG